MGRWEPNAQGRLGAAAMELFGERGFEQTTVSEIAERAGLSERTFFRHFADKREVLFAGSQGLQELLVSAVAEQADAAASPLDAVLAGLEAVGAMLEERTDFARQRAGIIAANAELRERELIKLASLGAAIAETLRAQGVGEPAASLTAELGIAVFRIAFERWVQEGETRGLRGLMGESLQALKAVTATR